MWSVLPMRSQARVLALISVMPKLVCAVYQQLRWNCQILAAEQLLPGQATWVALQASIMVKITPSGPLSIYSLAGVLYSNPMGPSFAEYSNVPSNTFVSLQAVGTYLKLNRELSLQYILYASQTKDVA